MALLLVSVVACGGGGSPVPAPHGESSSAHAKSHTPFTTVRDKLTVVTRYDDAGNIHGRVVEDKRLVAEVRWNKKNNVRGHVDKHKVEGYAKMPGSLQEANFTLYDAYRQELAEEKPGTGCTTVRVVNPLLANLPVAAQSK